jgi:hypothetical protein
MPLLEEDASVEANVPYREWLAAARGRRSELAWLIEQFENYRNLTRTRRALRFATALRALDAALQRLAHGMRMPRRKCFYHRGPLIQRREIDLRKSLHSLRLAAKVIAAARRESARHGPRRFDDSLSRALRFTHGDPKHVYRASWARRRDLSSWLAARKRLAVAQLSCAMIYKNGVPIGYFEGLSLFERMESGFNLYYTFRDGETAWLYARMLNVMHHFAASRRSRSIRIKSVSRTRKD